FSWVFSNVRRNSPPVNFTAVDIITSAHAASAAVAKDTGQTLSTFELLGAASPVVKLVLALLFFFSVMSWAAILHKCGVVRRSLRNAERFLDVFWSGKSMDHIYSESKKYPGAPVAKIFQSGYLELQRLLEKGRAGGTDNMQNLERALSRASRSE